MQRNLLSLLPILLLFLFSLSFSQFEDEEEEAIQPKQEKVQGEYAKDIRTREPELPKCDRPLGTIVARGFKCKAAACVGDRLVFSGNYTVQVSPKVLGDGLSDMIVTALVKTGCFKVLERETLEEIKEELELLGVKPRGALKGADFLLTGAVTALEMNASGMGGGGVVIPLPFLGGVGIKAGKSKAHIAIDMRLIRVRDAEVLMAETVEGKSERWKFGVGGGGLFGSVVAGGWFDAFKNTPMEEATRDLIYHSVKLIIAQVKNAPPVRTVAQEEVSEEPKVKRPSKSLASGGVVRRAHSAFKHGKVIWEENFSKCDVVPQGFKIRRGTVECVEFEGKKWIAAIKGDTVLEKSIPQFKPRRDWALEFTVYVKGGKGMYRDKIRVSLGRENSPFSIYYDTAGNLRIGEQSLPSVKNANGVIHTVGIMKKGNTVSVFVDGERYATVPVDSVLLSRMKGKLIFNLFADDIELGDYAFISDIKLSVF